MKRSMATMKRSMDSMDTELNVLRQGGGAVAPAAAGPAPAPPATTTIRQRLLQLRRGRRRRHVRILPESDEDNNV
jgi:hypothetical protein